MKGHGTHCSAIGLTLDALTNDSDSLFAHLTASTARAHIAAEDSRGPTASSASAACTYPAKGPIATTVEEMSRKPLMHCPATTIQQAEQQSTKEPGALPPHTTLHYTTLHYTTLHFTPRCSSNGALSKEAQGHSCSSSSSSHQAKITGAHQRVQAEQGRTHTESHATQSAQCHPRSPCGPQYSRQLNGGLWFWPRGA